MSTGKHWKLLVFLAAAGVARAQEVAPAVGEPAVGEPAVGEPAVGEPAVGEPAVGEPPVGEPDDGDGPVRLSLATEDDLAAWRRPGFRLALGANYGGLVGLDGPPGGWLLGVLLRVGARLDDHWSLMSSFHYGSASATGGLAGLRITGERPEDALFGLRFAGTLEPTWHINDHFELALGLGFGGLVEAATTGRPDVDEARRNALNGSYTYPDADPALPSCKGVGVAGLVRGGWHLILGPRSATGVTLEVFGQWTGCVDDTQRLELDTARPIVRRQWWPHLGSTVAWTVTWR